MEMDSTQASHLVDYMVGERLLNADANGNEFTAPFSPELKAFIIARLGDDIPLSGYDAFTRHQKKGRALVAFLREAADAIERLCGR